MMKGKAAEDPAKAPLVTVIVTTYNRVRLLTETIGSILNQSFTDFELIVVDNMSGDATEGYVRGLDDPRIRFFKNSNNGIIAVNRNFGIKRARGKYIAFCDDDDLWFRDKLKTQVEFMETNPGVGLTFSNAETFGEGASDGLSLYPKGESEGVKDFESLLKGNRIATFTVMVSKACLNHTGLFDENPELKSIEDYDLWLRIARKYALACMPEMLGKYRVHAARASGDKVSEKKKLLRLAAKFKSQGLADARQARRMESHFNWMIGNSVLSGGDAAFRAYYRRALSLSFNARTLLGFMLSLAPTGIAARILRSLENVRDERGRRRA